MKVDHAVFLDKYISVLLEECTIWVLPEIRTELQNRVHPDRFVLLSSSQQPGSRRSYLGTHHKL